MANSPQPSAAMQDQIKKAREAASGGSGPSRGIMFIQKVDTFTSTIDYETDLGLDCLPDTVIVMGSSGASLQLVNGVDTAAVEFLVVDSVMQGLDIKQVQNPTVGTEPGQALFCWSDKAYLSSK